MNKSKFFKILAPIVALGLLIGALVGFNAQAADGGAVTPEIVATNVEYGSELYLYYAVDKATVTGTPTLEVLSDAEGTDILYTVDAEAKTVTIGDKECYVFITLGVAPSQLNAAQYVRAADGDVKGAIEEYSVEAYLYTRLYKNGFAAKTEADGDDYVRRNLYFQLLAYGKSAQSFFDPDAADKIGAPGIAIKGNAAASGEYAEGDCIVLSADGIDGFDYWSVTEMTAFGEELGVRKLAAGYEYLVANSAVIVPVTDDDAAADVEQFDATVITMNTATPKFYNSTDVYGTHSKVYDAEAGNWYHKIVKVSGGTSSFEIAPTMSIPEDATAAEIKFDIWASADATLNTQFYFNTSHGESFRNSPFLSTVTNSLNKGAWNTVKVVYTPTSFADIDGTDVFSVEIYLNGELEETITENYSTGKNNKNIPKFSEIRTLKFSFNSAAKGEFYIDNASFIFK